MLMTKYNEERAMQRSIKKWITIIGCIIMLSFVVIIAAVYSYSEHFTDTSRSILAGCPRSHPHFKSKTPNKVPKKVLLLCATHQQQTNFIKSIKACTQVHGVPEDLDWPQSKVAINNGHIIHGGDRRHIIRGKKFEKTLTGIQAPIEQADDDNVLCKKEWELKGFVQIPSNDGKEKCVNNCDIKRIQVMIKEWKITKLIIHITNQSGTSIHEFKPDGKYNNETQNFVAKIKRDDVGHNIEWIESGEFTIYGKKKVHCEGKDCTTISEKLTLIISDHTFPFIKLDDDERVDIDWIKTIEVERNTDDDKVKSIKIKYWKESSKKEECMLEFEPNEQQDVKIDSIMERIDAEYYGQNIEWIPKDEIDRWKCKM